VIKRDTTCHTLSALAAATALLLTPGCTQESDENTVAGEPSNETLATLMARDDDLSFVSSTLSDAGLAEVFDGTAAYTIFAPTDAAFDALGEAGQDLRSPDQRAAVVAILRDHIVPGYLTRDDIARAIELSDDGRVQMGTMGARTLTFTEDGGDLVITSEDGAQARAEGESLRASNGVAIPLDGVLRRIVVNS
jgi:uncharacterized surface protein with fasciclin (FAS1) repeats